MDLLLYGWIQNASQNWSCLPHRLRTDCGIPGNEIVDAAAQAAEQTPIRAFTSDDLRRHISQTLLDIWQTAWNQQPSKLKTFPSSDPSVQQIVTSKLQSIVFFSAAPRQLTNSSTTEHHLQFVPTAPTSAQQYITFSHLAPNTKA